MSVSARHVPGVIVAMVLAFASLSVTTSPARGDGNEGGNPADRTFSAKISAGAAHTCAIIGSASTVWCWGDNSSGQLGNGTTVSSSTPVQVTGLTGAIAVSAGKNHTCAILTGGAGRCWGGGSFGQLGTGGTPVTSGPVAPAGGNTFTTISAGANFTCGTTSSQVRCWGRNTVGQLGNGNTSQVNSPTVANVPAGAKRSVSAGSNLHACAVMVSGSAYCWGDNVQGQLGTGVTGSPQSTPQLVTGVSGAEAITVNGAHSCALTAGGTKCWGLGADGQLGNGGTAGQPTPITTGSGTELAISAGDNHTCARLPGELRCWGRGSDGQLGNGSNASSLVPIPVPGFTGVPTITAGAFHTCVLFPVGQVDCFGSNSDGQLGNGTLVSSNTPVRVLDFPTVPQNPGQEPGSGEGSLTVSWSPPANLGGTPIKNYRIRDLNSSLDVLAPGNATSHTLTGLTPGQPAQISIAAINELGEGPAATLTPFTLSTLPYLKVGNVSAVEGNSGSKALTFTVTRFGKTSTAVSVKAATQNGDANVPAAATAPSDYTAKAATTLSFAAGETTKTFAVTVKGDKLAEDDESFYVVLSSPVGAEIWDGTGVGTLTNDDPGGKPVYAISNVSMPEGNSGSTNMTFTITRTGSTAVAGSIKYSTQALGGGAAAPGEDFTAKAPTGVTFPVGVVSKDVAVAIKGDLVAEPDELFRVALSDAVNGTLPAIPYAEGTILNDDSNTPTTIAIADVSAAEGDGFSKSFVFTITRSGNLGATTTVKYQTQNGSAVAPGDYTAKALTNVSFAPGVATKTVPITVKGGSVFEPDEEFFVVLSAVTGGSISDGTASGFILNDD
jgi:alpha-tubulin suppressor-like RCC1 family protein